MGPSLPRVLSTPVITSLMIVSPEISISNLGQLSSDCTADSLKAKSQLTLRQRDSPRSKLDRDEHLKLEEAHLSVPLVANSRFSVQRPAALIPGRSSLDSRQADVTNTCRLLTPVRNQDNFNEVTDEDFELLSAENTLTEDEKDDPDSGRLKIELTDEEKEKEASG
ncbi:hypothetical protein KQX54_000634 [Cotesia glomerata]|uniref:Uncharacterized protein n=1 Tax=Cotesia glomerata TaxID=32391 RepID=A0AAV7IXC9_COTGL|nr:hypothetical protein KQX54_000634 [Cotesia glomerata]